MSVVDNREKETTSPVKGWKKMALDFFDVIAFVIFVTGIIAVVRIYVFQPFAVVGSSMVPTFHEDDFVIVDKMSDVQRWDVVVFVPSGQKLPYIKRVVGLPGETVRLQNGKVSICQTQEANSCTEYQEDYLPDGTMTEARCGITSFDVTTGGLFVLWDNRWFSTDSRCCFGLGCYSGSNYQVTDQDMIGKVFMRIFPQTKLFNKEQTKRHIQ